MKRKKWLTLKDCIEMSKKFNNCEKHKKNIELLDDLSINICNDINILQSNLISRVESEDYEMCSKIKSRIDIISKNNNDPKN